MDGHTYLFLDDEYSVSRAFTRSSTLSFGNFELAEGTSHRCRMHRAEVERRRGGKPEVPKVVFRREAEGASQHLSTTRACTAPRTLKPRRSLANPLCERPSFWIAMREDTQR